ncbi:MAG TPA: di-trans,poly-cis-decaprenylcistransferase [Longimicrobiaceae bacterium]
MKQRALTTRFPGLHVAVIMDGNGRWAVGRGQPRIAGHREGAKVVREIVEGAPGLGIGTLTLYAFSSDNWKRPGREVSALMRLFRTYLASETAKCVQNGVRLDVIGRRDRIPPVLRKAIEAAEAETAGGDRLHLRIAIDYSARDTLVEAAAACRATSAHLDREAFTALIEKVSHSDPAPEVDLLIRTGGEQRLSDFLLWECAYAELYFDRCLWPDFSVRRLSMAVEEYSRRERRFGGLPAAAAS